MSALWLGCVAAVMAALLPVAAASVARARVAHVGTLGLCAAGALLDIAYLLAGAPADTLALPVGLPGSGMLLALDGLSGFFLLLVLLAGAASAAAGLDRNGVDPTAALVPVFVAAMALTVLAGDAFSLLVGFGALSLAASALLLGDHRDAAVRAAALLHGGVAVLGGVCLMAALALLAHLEPWGLDLAFTAMRADPPEGARAVAVLALVIVGAGGTAGLVPLHLWLPAAHAAPAPVSALIWSAATNVALYVMIRLLFDLCGAAQPGWWGVSLLAMGAAGAVLGGLRATLEGDLKAVLACSTIGAVGLIAVGLGVALAARAADLTALAALALGGALLHALARTLFTPLLVIAGGAVERHAGTRQLARLGGLVHRMPVTTACVLVGAACLAALPPSAGFAGQWTVLQALIAAPRIGGGGLQVLICAVTALLGLGDALAAAAAMRLVGVAFLGRPRTPRAAAADEARWPTRAALLALAGASVLVGLFPGAALTLAEPALRLAVGTGMAGRASPLVLAPIQAAPGYSAAGLGLLLGLALALVYGVVRWRTVGGHRAAPAWDGGFAPAPAWLPFGEPLTQYGGASFSQPLRRALGAAILGARETVDRPAASLRVALADPDWRLLIGPLDRAWRALSGRADAMQPVSLARALAVVLAVLVLALAAVVLVEPT